MATVPRLWDPGLRDRDGSRGASTAFLVLLAGVLSRNALGQPGSGFVERARTTFVLNGDPFPLVGLNSYNLLVLAAEPNLRSEVDDVLRAAKELGSTVVRTWAFSDGAHLWNALQNEPGVYSEEVFVGLDYVVQKAGQEGLRLVLPLVSNWTDFGGMSQYVEWSPTATTHDEFYTDANTRTYYKNHVARVLTRVNTFTGIAYKDDPTILGWELADEPRARDGGPAVLDAWIEEMATHLKSIDPRHLLSPGSDGFYGPAEAAKNPGVWMSREGVDFSSNHAHAAIDFASFHLFPDTYNMTVNQSILWVRTHFADARETLGKPVVLGGFGQLPPVPLRNELFKAVYDEAIRSAAPGQSRAGLLFWVLNSATTPDYDGRGIYFAAPKHASTTSLVEEEHRLLKLAVAPAPAFLRADASCDGRVTISDSMYTFRFLFAGEGTPCCMDALDANDDGGVDISDGIYTLVWLFLGGRPLPPPGPEDCGPDTTEDPLPDCGYTLQNCRR